MRTNLLLVSALALVATLPAHAQRGRGSQQGPPVKLHKNDIDATYIEVPVPPGESQYAKLDGRRMKQFVDEITGVARKDRDSGNRYWGRIAGSKADAEVEDLVAARFKEFGLADVHKQSFDLPPQWWPLDWDVRGTGSAAGLTFKTAFPGMRAPATPAAGVDLDVVWVGIGSELDFAGRDVKGKIAFIHSEPKPSGFQHTAAFTGALQRAADKGAAAVIVNISIPGNVTNEGASAPGVPTFLIGSQDAAALEKAMASAPVRLHLKLATEMRPGLKDASVWGTLPGATDEEIVVIAHHDSFFEGAFDNASGMATMLGMAEYYAKTPQAQRKRTLKFVTTAAHHAGSPGTAWMHQNKETALAKTVLMINCEHTSITQIYEYGPALRRSNDINARRWWVHGSDALASIALNSWKTFGVTVFDGMETLASGDMGSVSRDLPTIQLIVSPIFYHSDHDTPDTVPAQGLAATARAYAKIIDEVNKLERPALAPVRMSQH
jgi:hypothetical protein